LFLKVATEGECLISVDNFIPYKETLIFNTFLSYLRSDRWHSKARYGTTCRIMMDGTSVSKILLT